MQLLDIGHHHLLTHLIKQPEPPMHITDESRSNSLDHANAITAYFAPYALPIWLLYSYLLTDEAIILVIYSIKGRR